MGYNMILYSGFIEEGEISSGKRRLKELCLRFNAKVLLSGDPRYNGATYR